MGLNKILPARPTQHSCGHVSSNKQLIQNGPKYNNNYSIFASCLHEGINMCQYSGLVTMDRKFYFDQEYMMFHYYNQGRGSK